MTAPTNMIRRATETGMWLHSWRAGAFAPQELTKLNAEGRFNWADGNWELVDPKDVLAAAEREVERAAARVADIRARIASGAAGDGAI